ncbi:hypothetical protein D3C85_1338770 [compost metagenome]
MRKASASPPGSSNEKVEPEPLHWASKMACCSGEAFGPPAVRTALTRESARRRSTRIRAFSWPRSMRMCRVSRLRSSSQAVCGSVLVPQMVRISPTRAIRSAEPMQPPAIRSEWPPTYLVRE